VRRRADLSVIERVLIPGSNEIVGNWESQSVKRRIRVTSEMHRCTESRVFLLAVHIYDPITN